MCKRRYVVVGESNAKTLQHVKADPEVEMGVDTLHVQVIDE